ncbi:MAG TPA: hypothetical protein VLM89_17285 [Phycisphaerae bacterium]|nr:hypothetical protein [Phycisphaerae bacterium]
MLQPRSTRMRVLGLCAAVALAGCRSSGPDRMPQERDRIEMLSLMLPSEVKIEPFTKIRSFNDDDIPDGILAIIRPVDRFGDPVKAVGMFYFELWEYRQASQERRGQRIEFWEKPLTSVEDVRNHWSRAQMYEFQLAWTQGGGSIRPGRKYLFTTTYRTPWDTTIQDEYVIEFTRAGETPAESPPEATAR